MCHHVPAPQFSPYNFPIKLVLIFSLFIDKEAEAQSLISLPSTTPHVSNRFQP